MKKIADVLLTIFSIGIILSLFAGGISLIVYLVAMFIGETATALCSATFTKYLPWVIKFTSIFTLVGFVGMYFAKVKALTAGKTESAEESSK